MGEKPLQYVYVQVIVIKNESDEQDGQCRHCLFSEPGIV